MKQAFKLTRGEVVTGNDDITELRRSDLTRRVNAESKANV